MASSRSEFAVEAFLSRKRWQNARLGLIIGATLMAVPATAAASLPPAVDIPDLERGDRPDSEAAFASVEIHPRPEPVPVVLHVSPKGSTKADGSADQPFSIEQAQQAVREMAGTSSVRIELADGTYFLPRPLRFSSLDGGRDGHFVEWRAAEGAQPVISGGTLITGWRLLDQARNIWSAELPSGLDPRQLWVGDKAAHRAAVEAPRSSFSFHDWGIRIVDPDWAFLADLPGKDRLEIENTGFFTDRRAVVERIEGDRIILREPGWRNNIIGYDTFARPVSGDRARLFIANSAAFLRHPGDWFADPVKELIYYIPRDGEDMLRVATVAPRLEYLLSIAGSHDDPVSDLRFVGLSFRHSGWRGPSGPEGYVSQQSGAYLAGTIEGYPEDPIRDCSWGCRAFERMRNKWRQQPAAVQVAAARRITFKANSFSNIGQVALGIGNNADANAAGVGLGVQSAEITENVFQDLSGGAIMVGGITPDAHHPPTPEMAVRDIVIRDNTVRSVSQDYREQAAILVTYASAPIIIHNEVFDTPYDGIDVGWGWGINDPGGNTDYMSWQRGYYDQPGNLVYDTPTILRDAVIVANRVHGVKRWFPDGGAIYHLSADPGALIAENHVFDVPGGIGVYLDEGSRYVTVRENVFDGVGLWVNLNALDGAWPRRTAMDNAARGNWYNSGKANGNWSDYGNNRLIDNSEVPDGNWPERARAIIENAGPRRAPKPTP
ncbi:right-handed parallel beta-helix repeat-containing protein [Croceibacterium selenioxidans]|nr:right-handed parallel beta-helix repeat-containing protein [Croceibacterium selenioxidans]